MSKIEVRDELVDGKFRAGQLVEYVSLGGQIRTGEISGFINSNQGKARWQVVFTDGVVLSPMSLRRVVNETGWEAA
jgi:hypothetical protein